MTTKAGKEHAAGATLAAVAIIGLLVPLILVALVGFTPDTTLRVGDAGTFVSSNTSAGGFFALPATTLQTSTGSIVVSRSLSVVRGQHLRVEDRLKSGLQLCVLTTPPTCADVAGQWTGQLQPVERQRHPFTWLAEHIGMTGAMGWLLLGLTATLIGIFALAGPGGWSTEDEQSDEPDSAASSDRQAVTGKVP